MKKTFTLLLALTAIGTSVAQTITLPLDSCLALAIRNNKELSIAEMKQEVAHLHKREAFTNYLPKIDGTAAYMRTQKEISLLNDEQKVALENMGTTVGTTLTQSMTSAMQGIAAQNPQLAQQLQPVAGLVQTLGTQMVPMLNGAGASLVDALRTDTRNITAAALSLTQPLYMGGKIIAYNKITNYAEQIAGLQKNQKLQELVVDVETAYWQIVSLESKRRLAESYKALIDTMDYNVSQLIEQGMASRADGLSVKVKRNEADVTLIQIDNGLALCKMLLCQLCGIDLTTDIRPADEDMSIDQTTESSASAVETALANRPELQSLSLLSQINEEKVKVARAEVLPKVALSANYLWSNPSVFNGFEKKMKGMWAVGVMVNVPIIDWGEGYYKIRASKVESRIARANLDEVREKIELQTTQCVQKVLEASRREETAQRSMAQAEENLRMAQEGMQEGFIPISNVIEAQTGWLLANFTLIQARIDKRLAIINLQRAKGTLKM